MIFSFHKLSRYPRWLATRAARPGRILLALIVVFLGCRSGVQAQSSAAAPESQVKAAFLLNFPKYVEWPAEKFATTNSPFVVTVVGDAAVAESLAKMATGKTIHGRPVQVISLTSVSKVTAEGQILFLSATTRATAPELLARWSAANILTVGDNEDFLANGGVIRFARREQNVRLEVNLTAATQAQLKVSAKLLSVADVVKGTPK
jgi:hypothetical protein